MIDGVAMNDGQEDRFIGQALQHLVPVRRRQAAAARNRVPAAAAPTSGTAHCSRCRTDSRASSCRCLRRNAFSVLRRQFRPHQMRVRHPPVEQSVRQSVRSIERQPAEPRHRLAAAAHMRCPEDRVVEVEAGRGEFEGVFRPGSPGRKRDHPLGARLPGKLDRGTSLPKANRAHGRRQARQWTAANPPFRGRRAPAFRRTAKRRRPILQADAVVIVCPQARGRRLDRLPQSCRRGCNCRDRRPAAR